jgi:hypothetical protein
MTLKEFEKDISSKLIEKGYNYFMSDCVDNLDKVAPGLWMARVHGTETYIVEVRTHKTKIKGWDCDCPYNYGPICKHVIATFYAIAEKMGLKKSQREQKGGKKESVKKNRIGDIFKKASKEELQQFIVEQFRRDHGLKNAFIAYFAHFLDEDQEEKYRIIVRNMYKAAQGQHGFIDYHSADPLISLLFDLAQKAEELLAEKNIMESLSICKTLIEEVPVFIYNMDDSDGGPGMVMDQAFDTFCKIADQAPPLLKDSLFAYCLLEYPKGKYHDFGFEDRFIQILPLLITTKDQERKFFDIIDQQIEAEKGNTYPEYTITQLIKTKIDYLQRAKRENEALSLIEANIQYPEFREILVDQAIARKDFDAAKLLCLEGIKVAERKNYFGTENKWYNKLLEIAEKGKDIPEIRKWSEKLYFDDCYNMKYFQKLKSTYPKKEWAHICEEIINKLKDNDQIGGYSEVQTLAQIFVEEKYSDRLMKLLQLNSRDLFFIDNFSGYLKNEFPVEILALYEEGIKEYAKNTGRRIYNDVAKFLKKMKKIKGGKEEVKVLIQYFRNQYKIRRAMIEVLNKNFPETMPPLKGKEVQGMINKNLKIF